MSEQIHNGHRERLREAYRKQGMDGMADHVVLEMLLTYVIPRKDVNELAHRLLNTFGSLLSVLETDPKQLMLVDGVGDRTALYLHTLFDVHRRLNLASVDRTSGAARLVTPQEACRYALALGMGDRYETLRVICLDANMTVLHTEALQVGTLSRVSFEPRRVIEIAIKREN